MTHRGFGHIAVATAAALATLCLAAPAGASSSALPRLDITGVYVAGVSSGGFMATQLQVAYSATFDGAGVIAAGPYDCGQGNVIEFATCDTGAHDVSRHGNVRLIEERDDPGPFDGQVDLLLGESAHRSASRWKLLGDEPNGTAKRKGCYLLHIKPLGITDG